MWCTAEMEEEGLLLDALAITAQPLAIVAKAISPERCRAVGLQPSQLSVVCKRPPYLLQLRVQQVTAFAPRACRSGYEAQVVHSVHFLSMFIRPRQGLCTKTVHLIRGQWPH